MGSYRDPDVPEGYGPRLNEIDLEAAFGSHEIEYWVRKGNALLPATEREIAAIRAWEREQSAAIRLEQFKQFERRRRQWEPLWAAWRICTQVMGSVMGSRSHGLAPDEPPVGSKR